MKESPHRDRMRVICGAAFDHYIRTDDSGARPLPEGVRVDFRARGWITDAPPCEHPIEPAGVVLDPFFGAGTTGLVALQLGRSCIGIELNPEYVELARKRLDGVMPLFAQVDVRPSYDNSGKGRSGSRDYSQPCLIETLDKDGCDE